jgi:hypothetical protein
MPMADDQYFMQDAVRDLRSAGLDAEIRAYGFCFSHRDSAGRYEGDCGGEHDWSVSLAVRVNRAPVRWYCRYSVREMAEFLASSYARVCEGRFESLAEAMEEADGDYDHKELEHRLQALRKRHGCE